VNLAGSVIPREKYSREKKDNSLTKSFHTFENMHEIDGIELEEKNN